MMKIWESDGIGKEGMRRWLYSTNAKDIGTLYIILRIIKGLMMLTPIAVIRTGLGDQKLMIWWGMMIIVVLLIPTFMVVLKILLKNANSKSNLMEMRMAKGKTHTYINQMVSSRGYVTMRELEKRAEFWRERYMSSKLGGILLDPDKGITPEWMIKWKRKYMIGVGKGIFLAGICRSSYKIMIGYNLILNWYIAILVWILLGIVFAINMFYIFDFTLSLMYILNSYVKNVVEHYKILTSSGSRRGMSIWRAVRPSSWKNQNPGGPSPNIGESIARLTMKAGKCGIGTTGAAVTIFTGGQIYDIMTEGKRFEAGVIAKSYEWNIATSYNGVEEMTKSKEGKELVNKYGEGKSKVLLNRVVREGFKEYYSMEDDKVKGIKHNEVIMKSHVLGKAWKIIGKK